MITLGKCLKHGELRYSNEPHRYCPDYDGDRSQLCSACSQWEYRLDVPGYGEVRRGVIPADCESLGCYRCGEGCANQGEY